LSGESRSPPGPLAILLLTGLLCCIWGSTWVVIEGGLDDLPPFTSAAARFLLAAAGMTALAPWLARREGGSPPPLRLTLVLGTANFGCSYAIVYWSETRLPSGLVSVLWAIYPMVQAILGHRFLPGERLVGSQFAGFGLGFLGVVLLFGTDLRRIGPEAAPAGATLLLSPLLSALGTTFVKRHGRSVSSVRLNRNGMWIGAGLLSLAALLFERQAPARWTPGALSSVLYLAIAGTVIAFGIFFWLLRHAPANRLGVISYVIPAVALTLGVLLRGEPVTSFTVGGLGLILLGVFLVHRRRAREAPSGTAPGRG
jgi:drug/metabolite transporter (DMT)-like permease